MCHTKVKKIWALQILFKYSTTKYQASLGNQDLCCPNAGLTMTCQHHVIPPLFNFCSCSLSAYGLRIPNSTVPLSVNAFPVSASCYFLSLSIVACSMSPKMHAYCGPLRACSLPLLCLYAPYFIFLEALWPFWFYSLVTPVCSNSFLVCVPTDACLLYASLSNYLFQHLYPICLSQFLPATISYLSLCCPFAFPQCFVFCDKVIGVRKRCAWAHPNLGGQQPINHNPPSNQGRWRVDLDPSLPIPGT